MIERVTAQSPDDALRGHVLALLRRLTRMAERTICEGCGCLCTLDETCPGCRARRKDRTR